VLDQQRNTKNLS